MFRSRLQHRDAPTYALCLLLMLGGVLARIRAIDYAPEFTFDEHHFVENARNYLQGRADWNDHPPLGKLLIALGILARGDNALGWRLIACISGLGVIYFAFALGRRLFQSSLAGALAAALMAADGFLISYSRTALIDGSLTFFVLAATSAALSLSGPSAAVVAGGLAGAACGVKMSGISCVLWVLLVLALGGKQLLSRPNSVVICDAGVTPTSRATSPLRGVMLCLLALGSALLVYAAQWWVGLSVAGQPFGVASPVEHTLRLYQHHIGLNQMTHPLTSPWTSWLLPAHPIFIFRSLIGEHWRVVSTMGNPIVWWGASLTMLASLALLLWIGLRASLGAARDGVSAAAASPEPDVGSREGFLPRVYQGLVAMWLRYARSFVLLLLGWALFIAPWVLTRRDSYIYHYLPAYVFAVLGFAGACSILGQSRPLKPTWRPSPALVVACLVTVAFGFYLPVWTAQPMFEDALQLRLFLGGWR